VWSTRNALIGPYPSTYKDILGSLAVNAMLVHGGGELITPQITIDFLTLDDNNANIGDGTPHYTQINTGFTAHNMDAPPLIFLDFTYPEGKPAFIDPAGGEQFTVVVSAHASPPQPGTGVLYIDPEGDGTFASFPMSQISDNHYSAVFPAIPCGNVVNWYVSAQTTSAVTMSDPIDAPSRSFSTMSAISTTVAFGDDFQTDKGWTKVNNQFNTMAWKRGVPVGPAPVPTADFDGSGNCWFTNGNGAVAATLRLISPTIDATGGDYNVSYARWYSNNTGSFPNTDTMVVEVSNDNGTTWVNLETVGPGGPEASGGWYVKTTNIASKIAPTNQMKFRFNLTDVGGSSLIGAAVDAFRVELINCTPSCPADYNGDGFVDGIDYDLFNNDFEAGSMAADYNGDGFVDGIDYDLFNNDFEAGC
jgi:hypothetical protein